MGYASLESALIDLEKKGELVRIKEAVDPHLEMASIHLRVHAAGGPALLFEKVKGSPFRAASNLFGTLARSTYLFRDSLDLVRHLIDLKGNPMAALRSPVKSLGAGLSALNALPLKNPWQQPVTHQEIRISDLPLIQHWPKDGGAFVTLPQVYTEDPTSPGIMRSNLGMYRIQLTGNAYKTDEEIGLHYQLHRGIGIHQSLANARGEDLRVSCFVGGPPAHTLAAVMPLPEGLSEMIFAGVLGKRRFRYAYRDGFCLSTDADFVITGSVSPGANKPEGPFGDHLGYYSLQHDFPLMKVHKVYARKNAIWPFTVVGRPPQEDTRFGELIHALTGAAIQQEIPGVSAVHAVDAAGVHPLLLAVGSERYTPYAPAQQPAELLTQANRILGTGQLSLAKFLFISAPDHGSAQKLDVHDTQGFLQHVLARISWQRDIHFHTHTTMDTLDYSGTGLNTGSKVVFAAYGKALRTLATALPADLDLPAEYQAHLVMPGVVAIQLPPFVNAAQTAVEMARLNEILSPQMDCLKGLPFWVVADDAAFVAQQLYNFLWVAFTRCNPSHDIHGIRSFTENKHWGCEGPLLLDARIKPHHAPVLQLDPVVEEKTQRLFEKGGSLYGIG
ncbi:MAG: UbiD family decarboxylase [Sphingobacteriia bacterium]|nr:MAG: UbiD family decarboxylase [Sphingobacteriia bacterium]